jgi:hypothetical protein
LANPASVKDPIFGLSYSSEQAHFDEAPPDLLSACSALTNEKWDRRLWLFARVTSEGTEYDVLGGFYVKRGTIPSGEPKLEADPSGVMLRRNAAGCELIGPARESFDYKPQDVSPETLRALAADAVKRYAQAFGGLDNFVGQLKRQKVRLDNPRSQILNEAITTAR